MVTPDDWIWLTTTFDYWIAIYAVIAVIFFFLAVVSKDNSRFYGIIAGATVLWSFLSLIFSTMGSSIAGVAAGSIPGTFQFALSLIFLLVGFFFIYFALDAKNNVKKKEAAISTFLLAACMFFIGGYLLLDVVPVIFSPNDLSLLENLIPAYQLTLPFPVGRIILTLVPITFFVVGAYVFFEQKTKHYESKESEESDKFSKTMSKLDLEMSRKLYHVVIIVVIICYLIVGRMVLDVIYQFTFLGLPSLPGMPTGQAIYDSLIAAPNTGVLDFRAGHLLLLMAIGFIMLILFFTDIVRIKKYRYYPIKMLAKIYRDRERLVLAPHIFLTTGVFFVVVFSSMIDRLTGTPIGMSYSAHIVTITLMVSALADAVATIVGITKGKHHIRGGKKTWEGWIGGFVSAIILGILSFVVLMPLYGGDIGVGIIMALVAAAAFGLIDYLSPPISDNILNPLVIGLALWGIAAIV